MRMPKLYKGLTRLFFEDGAWFDFDTKDEKGIADFIHESATKHNNKYVRREVA
jgi:hypothetical protein